MESETPQQLAWRKEFESWPESKARMFSEASTTSICFDEHKAFARAWLAERAEAKRDAREAETMAIAKSAKASVRYDRYIAIAAMIIAAIAAHKEIKWLITYVISWLHPP